MDTRVTCANRSPKSQPQLQGTTEEYFYFFCLVFQTKEIIEHNERNVGFCLIATIVASSTCCCSEIIETCSNLLVNPIWQMLNKSAIFTIVIECRLSRLSPSPTQGTRRHVIICILNTRICFMTKPGRNVDVIKMGSQPHYKRGK